MNLGALTWVPQRRLGMLVGLSLGAVAGLAIIPPAFALDIPVHSSLVVDDAGVFSPEEAASIRASLDDFQSRIGPQIQLLTLPSLEGEPIERYSIRVAEKWKLGDAKRDDGVILLVALKDRALRIEVGQGLEGQIPDVIAGRIIRDTIVPRFKQGQVAAGIVAGLQEIAHQAGGELSNVPVYAQAQQQGGRRPVSHIFWLLIFLLFVLPRLFRGNRGSTLGGLAGGYLLGRGSRGGGLFGGGGGGFGGGGGGGFSGGGSSGNW